MKNKSNILIIITVILAALTVFVVVMTAGFFKSKSGDSSAAETSFAAQTYQPAEPSLSDEPDSPAEESPQPAESSDSAPDSSFVGADNIGQTIADAAKALCGVPFAENGADPNGFDNSGFIYYVLRGNGYITCPRTTSAQAEMGTKIGRDALKAGDLVFFGEEGSDEVSFGGIYIGNNTMVACLMPGTEVKETDMSSEYYAANFRYGISLS